MALSNQLCSLSKLPERSVSNVGEALHFPNPGQEPKNSLDATIHPPRTAQELFREFVTERAKFDAACARTNNSDTMRFLDEKAKTSVIYDLMNERWNLERLRQNSTDPSTVDHRLAKLDATIRLFCEDRIERFKAFNELVGRGVIRLESISHLRGDPRYLAQREVLDFFECDSRLRLSPLTTPSRDFIRRPSRSPSLGVASPDKTQASTSVLRIPSTPRLGLDPESLLLAGDNSIEISIAAVNAATERLAALFPHRMDFDKVTETCGIGKLNDAVKAFVSATYTLTDDRFPELTERMKRDRQNAESRIPILARDIVQRYRALESVLQHPGARDALLSELTPGGRLTSYQTLGHPAHSEAALKYEARINSLIRLLQSSPDVIAAAQITPPPAPIRVPVGETSVRTSATHRSSTSVDTSPDRRERRLPDSPLPVEHQGLPRPTPVLAGIRAQAAERSKNALTTMLSHSLGSTMHTRTANGRDPTISFLRTVAGTVRVEENTFSDYEARQRLVATNKMIETVFLEYSPFHRLAREKQEMTKEISLAEKSAANADDFQKSVENIRGRYAKRAEEIVRAEIPLLNPNDINFPELLLSTREIGDRRTMYIRNRDLETIRPPKAGVRKAEEREAFQEGRAIPKEKQSPSVPALPVLPTPLAEQINAPSSPDMRYGYSTSTRQTQRYLPGTETSMILVEGMANGQRISVVYDTLKQTLLTDRGLAEASGIRFIHTGETGPNGMPKVQIDFTLAGDFRVEYRGINSRTAGVWSGKVTTAVPRETNLGRLNECRAAGENAWHKSLNSAATLSNGQKFLYAYSKSEKQLFAKTPDGKSFFTYDEGTNTWYRISPDQLPSTLQRIRD